VAPWPTGGAVTRCRRWHAEQISNALTEAGIPHDPAAIRSVLLWEDLTENERSSDLGNLPRLLSVLGLGGQWDDWVRQAEAPPPPPPPESEPEAEGETEDEAPSGPGPAGEDPFGAGLGIPAPPVLTPMGGRA